MKTSQELIRIETLLNEQLSALVHTIDQEGLYPKSFLRLLGNLGYFSVQTLSEAEMETKFLQLIEATAKHCVSTAFLIWCQITLIRYIRASQNEFLQQHLLPALERGECLGGTGLSNAMKFLSDMEPLRLKAVQVNGGYRVSGTLPFVSNLGSDHWFAFMAETADSDPIVAVVPCHAAGLELQERRLFIALNGTATYCCYFHEVFIPPEWILADPAHSFVKKIRPGFVLSQSAMGLGLTQAAVQLMNRFSHKQKKANSYLPLQPEVADQRQKWLHNRVYDLARSLSQKGEISFRDIVQVRLEAAELALETAQAAFLHSGGTGYIRGNEVERRVREALFFAIVTPAVKQLRKELSCSVA